jgi:hypothetical protein
VSHRVLAGFSILAALVLGWGQAAPAHEPDGRVAFRYAWESAPDGDPGGPKLRLSMTAFVDLAGARLSAALPQGVGLAVQPAGSAPAPWSREGLAIGRISAGQTVVFEFDVTRPEKGGGIVGFVLQAEGAGGRLVTEGVGVPVGTVGMKPATRNGAAEFPASRPETSR